MFSTNILFISFIGAILFAADSKADPAAVAKCRSIHHMDADIKSTFMHGNCSILCIIHGKSYQHNLNEGMPCAPMPGTCLRGSCVMKQGYIDLNLISASFPKSASSYLSSCILNSSEPISLPLKQRSNCVTCTTKLIKKSKNPRWDAVCSNSSKNLFSPGSRIVFEAWEKKKWFFIKKTVFLGGTSVTIPQLLSRGDNHRELNLALVGGKSSGLINVRITWTPI